MIAELLVTWEQNLQFAQATSSQSQLHACACTDAILLQPSQNPQQHLRDIWHHATANAKRAICQPCKCWT